MVNGYVTAFDWSTGATHTTTAYVADGQWHHVAMSFQSGVSNGSVIYVDGVAVANIKITVASQNQFGLAIGSGDSNAGTYQNFTGTIDEVHVWDRVLTASEIAGLVPAETTGLLAPNADSIVDGSFE